MSLRIEYSGKYFQEDRINFWPQKLNQKTDNVQFDGPPSKGLKKYQKSFQGAHLYKFRNLLNFSCTTKIFYNRHDTILGPQTPGGRRIRSAYPARHQSCKIPNDVSANVGSQTPGGRNMRVRSAYPNVRLKSATLR